MPVKLLKLRRLFSISHSHFSLYRVAGPLGYCLSHFLLDSTDKDFSTRNYLLLYVWRIKSGIKDVKVAKHGED